MALRKIGSVRMPGGSIDYDVYWDTESGQVKVASEPAGSAGNERDALHVADYYASTLKQKFLK
jgi:hypothetical protein